MQPEARCFAIASIAGQLGLAFPRSVFLSFLPHLASLQIMLAMASSSFIKP